MDEPRYNITVKVDITDADGASFFHDTTEWVGCRYIQVVAVEDALMTAMAKLVDMSYAQAEARGADPQEVAAARRLARGT